MPCLLIQVRDHPAHFQEHHLRLLWRPRLLHLPSFPMVHHDNGQYEICRHIMNERTSERYQDCNIIISLFLSPRTLFIFFFVPNFFFDSLGPSYHTYTFVVPSFLPFFVLSIPPFVYNYHAITQTPTSSPHFPTDCTLYNSRTLLYSPPISRILVFWFVVEYLVFSIYECPHFFFRISNSFHKQFRTS